MKLYKRITVLPLCEIKSFPEIFECCWNVDSEKVCHTIHNFLKDVGAPCKPIVACALFRVSTVSGNPYTPKKTPSNKDNLIIPPQSYS